MPVHASQLYAKNIAALMQLVVKDKALNVNFADDIVDAACITHNGEIRNQRIKDALQSVAV
jgi:NAD(P) transhydrogenase subunit alpha